MRIVTWNMGCGSKTSPYRRYHNEAWEHLLKNLKPDFALAQEALFAKFDEFKRSYSVVLCNAGPDVDAGTGVMVRGLDISEIPPVVISPHTYSAAIDVCVPAGRLACSSFHPFPGKHLFSDLNQIVKKFGSLAGINVVIGGDFNDSRHWDEVYGGKKHRNFFAAMDEAGLFDAHWGIHGRESQSVWTRRTTEPYQNDHIFVTRAWARRVSSCRVIDDNIVRRLSDHGPVLLEIDVS